MTKKIFMAMVLTMAVMVGALQTSFAAAKANVTFEISNVVISDGKCDIQGFFYNSGDKDAKINAMQFTGTIKDAQGKVMYGIDFAIDRDSEDCSKCIVPANGKIPASFTLSDEGVVAYNGDIDVNLDYKVSYE